MKNRLRAPFESVGFSLVEVVMALGIFAFVVVALVGLFSVGLNTGRESSEELEAAHLTESMFAARRSAPIATTVEGCLLPPLNIAADTISSPVSIPGATGAEGLRYSFSYRISPPDTTRKVTRVYVRLSWPPPPAKPAGTYEAVGSFLLP